MLGHDGFTVTPRRGELIVFDKLSRSLVEHVILCGAHEDHQGRADRARRSSATSCSVRRPRTSSERTTPSSTADGSPTCARRERRIVPALLDYEVTAVYVGLRAATEHADYQVSVHADEGYACVGGIRSTGLIVIDGPGRARPRRARGRRPSAGAPSRRPARDPHAEHRRALPAPLPAGGAGGARPRLRPDRLLLRARHARRGAGRPRLAHSAGWTSTACAAARARTWAAARASSVAPSWRNCSRGSDRLERHAGRGDRGRRPGRCSRQQPNWSDGACAT